MVKVEADFEPNPANANLYNEQHQIYREFYESMANAGAYQKPRRVCG